MAVWLWAGAPDTAKTRAKRGPGVRVQLNQAELREFLQGPSGPVFRRVASYSRRVENRAKQKVGVDSGRLRSSINHTVNVDGGKVIGRVGSMVDYARYHHDGTGIYGPSGQPIRPTSSKVLVFTPKGSRTKVFAHQVRGSPPNPYLKEALREIVPWPLQATREG